MTLQNGQRRPARTFRLAQSAVSVHPLSLTNVTERDQQLPAGVPLLIDQYKQRRQAWLAQADELVRLRDQVRSAAEQEALDIVTAARRDVRRIVVEARRELLVLTAQLHAAIESVDQASLQAAAGEAEGHNVTDLVSGQRALGVAEDKVLGARREVRSVLDEARAEIEALVAEASVPFRETPAALVGSSPLPDPPIPTLDTILGTSRNESDHHDDGPGGGSGKIQGTWQQSLESVEDDAATQPFASGSSMGVAVLPPPAPVRRTDEVASLVAAVAESPAQSNGARTSEQAVVELLADFGDTVPVQAADHPRTFLADTYDDDEQRTRPAWLWVGLFAATGILAVVTTVWWFTLRDSGTALATSATALSEPAAAATAAPVADRAPAAVPAGPSGLGIEVRRTAWIRTIVDGKEDSRVYQAGETRQISGAKTVSIRAGDGGAVFVSVDGRPAEPLGSGGVAVTRQYSLAGGTTGPVAAVATASAVPAVEPLAAGVAASRPETSARPEPQSLPLPAARPAA